MGRLSRMTEVGSYSHQPLAVFGFTLHLKDISFQPRAMHTVSNLLFIGVISFASLSGMLPVALQKSTLESTVIARLKSKVRVSWSVFYRDYHCEGCNPNIREMTFQIKSTTTITKCYKVHRSLLWYDRGNKLPDSEITTKSIASARIFQTKISLQVEEIPAMRQTHDLSSVSENSQI